MYAELLSRFVGAAVIGFVGWQIGFIAAGDVSLLGKLPWAVPLCAVGIISGFLAAPYLIVRPVRSIWSQLKRVSAQNFLAGVIGLLLALIVSALVALPLSLLPGVWSKAVPPAVALVLSILGISVLVARGHELWTLSAPMPGATPSPESRNDQIILDTNAIIDGRIADVSQTGFLQGTLLIPRFVLDELRHIADSPDPLRRNRGRRGLDMLTKLQRESDVPIQVIDADFPETREVDVKLVKLARRLRCAIVSNDFNLNRVAEIQGVQVLNINELANAVKPVVLPGEEMGLRIVQEGKEAGQGVGFLDDGTMVVVEGGRRYLNSDLAVVVTRVLQTAAGRMIFAHPKDQVNERGKR